MTWLEIAAGVLLWGLVIAYLGKEAPWERGGYRVGLWLADRPLVLVATGLACGVGMVFLIHLYEGR